MHLHSRTDHLQTMCLCGYAIFLFALSFTTTYHGALFCMTLAVGCSGFHNSGILVNPTDIAPNYAGSVFGMCCYFIYLIAHANNPSLLETLHYFTVIVWCLLVNFVSKHSTFAFRYNEYSGRNTRFVPCCIISVAETACHLRHVGTMHCTYHCLSVFDRFRWSLYCWIRIGSESQLVGGLQPNSHRVACRLGSIHDVWYWQKDCIAYEQCAADVRF